MWGATSSSDELTGDFDSRLKVPQAARAACFVFWREISRTAFWDFCNTIGAKRPFGEMISCHLKEMSRNGVGLRTGKVFTKPFCVATLRVREFQKPSARRRHRRHE